MSEVHIFSIRKIVLISLLLSLITLTILSTATVNKSDDNDGNKSSTINLSNQSSSTQSSTSSTSSNTSSTTTSSTSSATSSTTSASDTNTEFGTQTSGTAAAPPQSTAIATQTQATQTQATESATKQQDVSYFETNVGAQTDEIVRQQNEKADGIKFKSIDSSLLFNLVNYGFQIILMGLIFFSFITVVFVYAINSPEVVTYVNKALKLSGFKAKFSNIGKSIKISLNSKIKITGANNLSVKFTMPIIGNPEEFGLRIINDHVETECKIDSLPIKLQVIYLYLNQK